MYSGLQLATKYIQYYLHASNSKGHGVHSPFVFDFIKNVLNRSVPAEDEEIMRSLRKQMKHSRKVLEVCDFGAGSRVHNQMKRSVSSIASTAAKPPKYGRMFYNLIKHYGIKDVLEFGTSLGMTTGYMSLANPQRIISLEGSIEIAGQAAENFKNYGLKGIEQVTGNFDETMETVLSSFKPQLTYIDGNHRYEPTVRYFRQLLPRMENDSIIVFDDIHWSREMEQAWNEVIRDRSVTLSIDLFMLGLVFFRKEQKVKQDFAIRY